MSNSRFFLRLATILLALLLIGMREVYESGPFAGIWIGVIILPVMFIISLMIGVLCGLRTLNGNNIKNKSADDPDK